MLERSARLNDLIIRLRFLYTRLVGYGVKGIGKRIIKKMVIMVLSLALLPVSAVLYLAGCRRVTFFTDRIGHLAIEPDTLLKAQGLGLVKRKRWFVLAPAHRVSNQHLMQYWSRYFTVYRSSVACFFMHCLSSWPFLRYDVTHYINNGKGSQWGYEVNRLWGERPPVLTLTEEDKQFGDRQLADFGIPPGAWFVCVHVREGGFSPIDEVYHSHRNGKIENLIPAIEEITRRGGWVIRLGDPTMVPLKQMPQVIDYAHHPLRSARLDIILCARARFILGNTSGVFLIGTAFGVPSALANMIPMPTLGFLRQDVSMPKLLWDNKKERYLSFAEVMSSPVSTYRYASLYQKNNITPIENSSDDILSLTIEMLDRLDGCYSEDDEGVCLQTAYMALLEPCHYSYGAISQLSTSFLKRHRHLLMGDNRIV